MPLASRRSTTSLSRPFVRAIVLFALLAPGGAQAGTLDQQQIDTSGGPATISGSRSMAQTFTVSVSGSLDRIDLFVLGGVTQPLNVSIQTLTAMGVPSGTELASEPLQPTSVPDHVGAWVPIVMEEPVPVAAAAKYAIVAATASPDMYALWRSATDAYTGGTLFTGTAGGAAWSASDLDLAFKTYVAPATAVSVHSLSATRSPRGVVVRWSTSSELDVLGFHVHREVDGRRVRATARLIPARGTGSGRTYSYVDRRAPKVRVLRYWIQAVHADGSRRWYGPARA